MATSKYHRQTIPPVDPLLLNGIIGWLEDLKHAPPELSLAQLEAVLEAQAGFTLPGDPGDAEAAADRRLLTEMKRALTALRRQVAKKKPIAKLARARTKRAFARAGVPREWLSEGSHKYQNAPKRAKAPSGGSECPTPTKRAKKARSLDTSESAGGGPPDYPSAASRSGRRRQGGPP